MEQDFKLNLLKRKLNKCENQYLTILSNMLNNIDTVVKEDFKVCANYERKINNTRKLLDLSAINAYTLIKNKHTLVCPDIICNVDNNKRRLIRRKSLREQKYVELLTTMLNNVENVSDFDLINCIVLETKLNKIRKKLELSNKTAFEVIQSKCLAEYETEKEQEL